MKVDVVVDVGNSRIKWGRCSPAGVAAVASLPDAADAWQRQLEDWGLTGSASWAIASVRPQRSAGFAAWLRQRGQGVWLLESYQQLPLAVDLPQPERVGIDRLLNAVAVRLHRDLGRVPAVIVDAGTAVTVDWVDTSGTFRGGAIFPGWRLMAQALHEHTAQLPLVAVAPPADYPGRDTVAAIRSGVYHAVTGGINALVQSVSEPGAPPPTLFVTGGDAQQLLPGIRPPVRHWPAMTLEGLRLVAEALP